MGIERSAAATLLVVAIATGCGLDSGGLASADDAGTTPVDGSSGSDAATFGDGATNGGDAGGGSDATAPSDGGAMDGGSADSAADARADAAPDAGACNTGVICNGQCTTDLDCSRCTAGNVLCGPTNTCGDCSTCKDAQNAPLPIQCFSCDLGGNNPLGTCAPNDRNSYCLNGIYPIGRAHCPCSMGSASGCPGDTQVCVSGGLGDYCATCGENGTDNQDCHANNTKCSVSNNPPRCK